EDLGHRAFAESPLVESAGTARVTGTGAVTGAGVVAAPAAFLIWNWIFASMAGDVLFLHLNTSASANSVVSVLTYRNSSFFDAKTPRNIFAPVLPGFCSTEFVTFLMIESGTIITESPFSLLKR